MKWILGAGEEIVVGENQLKARTKYIHQVTEVAVSDWQIAQVNNHRFLYCMSSDAIDGVFITAHIGDILLLSTVPHIYGSRIIVANTCIWEKSLHKKLLNNLYRVNSNLELYFAKQDGFIDPALVLRQTTTLLNVGNFGFQTSQSERELFMNRKKGFEEAVKQSFERVSPILFVGE